MAAILQNGRQYNRYVFLNGFTVIFDPENIYLRTKIMVVGESEVEILENMFYGGHIGKWPPIL